MKILKEKTMAEAITPTSTLIQLDKTIRRIVQKLRSKGWTEDEGAPGELFFTKGKTTITVHAVYNSDFYYSANYDKWDEYRDGGVNPGNLYCAILVEVLGAFNFKYSALTEKIKSSSLKLDLFEDGFAFYPDISGFDTEIFIKF